MIENLFDLTGKVAPVTGVNSGLGFGFAEGLAQAGSELVIRGRRKDANAQAADRLRALGEKVHSKELDVTDEVQIVLGVADAIAAVGCINTVVTNAGIAKARHSKNASVTNDIDRAGPIRRDQCEVPAFNFFENDTPGLVAAPEYRMKIALAHVGGLEIEQMAPATPVYPAR